MSDETIECTVEGGPLNGRTLHVRANLTTVHVPVPRARTLKFYAENEPMPMEVGPWGELRMPRPKFDQYVYERVGTVLRPKGGT